MMSNMDKFLEYLSDIAYKLKEDAGYQGSMNDDRASNIYTNISIYRAGQQNIIPSEWKDEYINWLIKHDPEYTDYVRLNEKFGDL